MPELPEVETSRRGITPHLEQQRIAAIIVRQKQLRWPITPGLNTKLTGHTIQQVSRRGKYILIVTDNGTVLLHLGMSGNLRILPKDTPPLKHDHIDFVLESGKCLRFNDPRRFGCVLWTSHDAATHPLLETLGPEPLTDDFNTDYLYQATRNKKTSIKQLIMNSKIVVGVGNIYACEALFAARILPTKAANLFSKKDCAKLVAAIKPILQRSIDIGGTTLRDFVNSEGNPGYFKQMLTVYGRTGLECVTCKTILQEVRLNNRSTVFCSKCQK